MKTAPSTLRILTLAVLAAQSAFTADQSQLPISRTAGIASVPVDAAKTTLVGLPFIKEPVTQPVLITAVASPTATSSLLTSAGATFGDFTTTPHSVQIIGGAQNGFVVPIAANDATTITTSEVLPGGIKPNLDRMIVIPDWTLGSLGLQAALTANADPSLADKVKTLINNVETVYFYNGSDWRLVSAPAGASQANVRLPQLGGLIIERVAGNAVDLVFHGVARSGTQRTFRPSATSLLLTNPFPSGVTLGNSGIDQIVAPAPTPSGAETVSIMVNNTLTPYFYQAGRGWKLVSDPNGALRNNQSIPAGTAVLIQGTATGQAQVFPRRWRWGRPASSFAPVFAPASNFWVGQEPFVTGP